MQLERHDWPDIESLRRDRAYDEPTKSTIISPPARHTFFLSLLPNLTLITKTQNKQEDIRASFLFYIQVLSRRPHALHLTRTTIPATPPRLVTQRNAPPRTQQTHYPPHTYNRNHGARCMG